MPSLRAQSNFIARHQFLNLFSLPSFPIVDELAAAASLFLYFLLKLFCRLI